jgi:hypothetical protein
MQLGWYLRAAHGKFVSAAGCAPGFAGCLSFGVGEEFGGADTERVGELEEVGVAGVAFAAFDAADVVSVEAALVAQVLLGEAVFASERA